MHDTKTFLFLQRPHSIFFSRLADRIEDLGHRALRINLCFSDWLFWRRAGSHHYRGRFKDWPGYLRHFLLDHGVTDIVLLGEQRPYHRVAVELAAELDLHVTVTEWGYLRPDWITFERDGMSGNTRFPKDREAILALASDVSQPDYSLKYPDSFLRIAVNGFCGDMGSWALAFLYPGYRPHISTNPLLLYVATGVQIVKSKLRRRRSAAAVARLRRESGKNPYFVFPMQIDADYQIRAYSRYSGMGEALDEIIRSFSRFAPGNARLLVKVHPLDSGLKPWATISSKLAAKHGATGRVFFIDGGKFSEATKDCAGVVTVNSTCGVEALKANKPVKALGQAIYDIPGLTHQGSLDSFWSAPHRPERTLCDAFLRAISSCIQIKGGFFSKNGVEAAASIGAHRLANGSVNRPFSEPAGGDRICAPIHRKHAEPEALVA